MKISFNVTGAERKALVATITEAIQKPQKYLGAPTFAYEVGGYNIDKDGTVAGEDNPTLVTFLNERGFAGTVSDGSKAEPMNLPSEVPERFTYRAELCDPESPDRMEIFTADSDENAIEQALEYCTGEVVLLELHQLTDDYEFVRAVDISQPHTIAIELPTTNVKPEILTALLNSKTTLIAAALGEDACWYSPEPEYSPENPGPWYGPAPRENSLPIEFNEGEGKVRFEWLKYGADSDAVKAWSEFLAAAVKFSKTANRITAKDVAVENQKFAFRTFLVKIGLNDAEHKQTRKYLLRNLAGDSAFATPESKRKWLAKHGSKKEQ